VALKNGLKLDLRLSEEKVMGDKEFLGKVVLVTGASDGIGAEIAFHFSGLGANVLVNFNNNVEGAV